MSISTFISQFIGGRVEQQPQKYPKWKVSEGNSSWILENFTNKIKRFIYSLLFFVFSLQLSSPFPINIFPMKCFSIPYGPVLVGVHALPPTSHCFGSTVSFLVTQQDFKVAPTPYHLSTFLPICSHSDVPLSSWQHSRPKTRHNWQDPGVNSLTGKQGLVWRIQKQSDDSTMMFIHLWLRKADI